ncbi:hypothetical protein [Streptomyces sp. TLI_146]|uniref:hypothetical protein n=1 Tax=Streptomyces sp. TLI_146 TaxID=1938858 RepID=UPI000C70748E|nr:hypothetical protein [Streptomyces sp. TLI_146]PKV82727.1 hypothetical protein BX283_0174 [Streptomyces sp. TLI_146]
MPAAGAQATGQRQALSIHGPGLAAAVLGRDNTSLRTEVDGWPPFNGHRVTREMCAAIQARRPEQAHGFVYENVAAVSKAMGQTECSGPLFGRPW